MTDLPPRLKGAMAQALESAQEQLERHANRGVGEIGCLCRACVAAARFIKEATSHE